MSAVATPAALSLSARLLALVLGPPDAATAADARLLAEALSVAPDVDEALRERFAEIAALLADEGVASGLAAAYHAVFGGGVRVSPYESSYEADPFRSGRQLADVAGFYRAFGAQPGGSAAERADHVACELEFLAFLVAARVEAGDRGDEAGAEVCLSAEDRFLEEHLGRVLPLVCRHLAVAEGASPVHRAAAFAAERLVLGELDARGLSPVAPPRARPRTAVEDDELTCASAGEAVIATAERRGRERRRRPA